MTRSDTKECILDQAEALFAAHGYQATSLRQITAAAGVNLAAVSYHFGSKEGLVAAVIERRLAPLNDQRRERLEKVLAAARQTGSRPDLSEVLLTFIEPTMLLSETVPGASNFVTLIGRAMADPDETARHIFIRHMGPILKFFQEGLGPGPAGHAQGYSLLAAQFRHRSLEPHHAGHRQMPSASGRR
jgi:AcrR family transcriptional regulator